MTKTGLLPRGPAQLVEHFTTVCDHAFLEMLERKQDEFAGANALMALAGRISLTSHVPTGMRTQHRIAAAVRMRLELLQPYITSWSQALSLQARSERAVAQW